MKKPYQICDDLWRDVVKKNAGGKCEHCGSTKVIQAHHIIPRTNWALRFNERNGVALCRRCHLYWAHKDGVAFTRWLEEYKPGILAHLEINRHNTAKNDYGLIKIYLEQKIEGLE